MRDHYKIIGILFVLILLFIGYFFWCSFVPTSERYFWLFTCKERVSTSMHRAQNHTENTRDENAQQFTKQMLNALKHDAAFLDADTPREDLGRAVHDALVASRFTTPDHPEWDAIMRMPTDDEIKSREDDLKRRAGVKTNKALYTGVGRDVVTLRDGQIELCPLRHRGRGAWEGIRGHEPIRLPESVSDEVVKRDPSGDLWRDWSDEVRAIEA